MIRKMVKCQCGFVVRATSDDQLVAELQKHAKEDHKLDISRETILAMAQPDPGRSKPNSARAKGPRILSAAPSRLQASACGARRLFLNSSRVSSHPFSCSSRFEDHW